LVEADEGGGAARACFGTGSRDRCEYNHYDFCLTRQTFAQVEDRFGPHSIDRFASDRSHQLPRYNTKYFSPKAEGLDAFSLNWAGDNNYLFPPPSLVGQAMYHASVCGADITIVYMQRFSRPYMQSLRRYELEGKLLDTICLGSANRVLEYRNSSPRVESRYQHLPKGHVFASRIKFG
jgi:hypothetical protein